MKYHLSLFIFICLVKVAWAEDFKPDIAFALVKATEPESSGMGFVSKHQDTPDSSVKIGAPKPLLSTAGVTQFESGRNMPRYMDYEVNNPARGMVNDNPELGFYSKQHSEQSPNAKELFDQLHDEVRFMVGEDIYAKMAWTYFDLKQLDNWIYATMSQYDAFDGQTWAGSGKSSGLSQQFGTDLAFLGLFGSDEGVLASAQAAGGYTNLTSRESIGLTTSYAGQVSGSDFESQNIFLLILKYLNISNFLYLILSIVGAVYLAIAFKFFVRQE